MSQDVHQYAASVVHGFLVVIGLHPNRIGDYELPHLDAHLLARVSASTMAGPVPSQRTLRGIYFCVWPERVA